MDKLPQRVRSLKPWFLIRFRDSKVRFPRFIGEKWEENHHLFWALVFGGAMVGGTLLLHWRLWDRWVTDTDVVDATSLALELAFAALVIASVTLALAAIFGWYVVQEYRDNHKNPVAKVTYEKVPGVPETTNDSIWVKPISWGNAGLIKIGRVRLFIENNTDRMFARYRITVSGEHIKPIYEHLKSAYSGNYEEILAQLLVEQILETDGGGIGIGKWTVRVIAGAQREVVLVLESNGDIPLYPGEKVEIGILKFPWKETLSENVDRRSFRIETTSIVEGGKLKREGQGFSDVTLRSPIAREGEPTNSATQSVSREPILTESPENSGTQSGVVSITTDSPDDKS